jgi:hypothetical protein
MDCRGAQEFGAIGEKVGWSHLVMLAVHFLTYRTSGMADSHLASRILDSGQGDCLVTSVFWRLKLDVLP